MGTSAAERAREEGRRDGLREAADRVLSFAMTPGNADLGPAARLFAADLRAKAGTVLAQVRLDGGTDEGSMKELTARATIVLMAHLQAREKFFREERGVYQAPSAAAIAEVTKEIKAALIRHHETNGDREKWRKESAVLAAGIGILYSAPHNGELEIAKKRDELAGRKWPTGWLPKLYLELWRPWKLQRGKPDPVPGFAEKCFERRREGVR